MEQGEDGGAGAADHADGRGGQRVIEGGWGVEVRLPFVDDAVLRNRAIAIAVDYDFNPAIH